MADREHAHHEWDAQLLADVRELLLVVRELSGPGPASQAEGATTDGATRARTDLRVATDQAITAAESLARLGPGDPGWREAHAELGRLLRKVRERSASVARADGEAADAAASARQPPLPVVMPEPAADPSPPLGKWGTQTRRQLAGGPADPGRIDPAG